MRSRDSETKLIVEYLWDGTLQSPVLALERQNFVFVDNIPPSWLLMHTEDLGYQRQKDVLVWFTF